MKNILVFVTTVIHYTLIFDLSKRGKRIIYSHLNFYIMTNFIIKTKVFGFVVFQTEKNFSSISQAMDYAAKKSFLGIIKTIAIYNY